VKREKLIDDDIRQLWAEHFPKRQDDSWSKTLCLAFCLTVERLAARHASDEDDVLPKVHEALDVMGIPRDEFYQLEKESDDE
jgi:hypothetical protein